MLPSESVTTLVLGKTVKGPTVPPSESVATSVLGRTGKGPVVLPS